ncbi:hypothetical protein KAT84_04445, partial [Candidatus Bipolaricaulota bacterium]|nr:hypothetical protein [Candidatus Bipolaricaulota bacterium]
MHKWRWIPILLSTVCFISTISAAEDISLHFSGHLAAGQGTCQQISDSQISCQVSSGSLAILELEAMVSPPEHGVTITAWELPSWVAFAPVSGHGTVSTQATINPPASTVGYTVTLVFTATTAYELQVHLEVKLLITETGPPGYEEPDHPYDVPGGEETDQGIEFEIPFMPSFSTFTPGEVTDCETGNPIDASKLTTEFIFPPGAEPPYELIDLEKAIVRSPGYLPHEITEFQPFSISLLFIQITLLMPADPNICLEPIGEATLESIEPIGPCVGDVTTSIASPQAIFRWEATGQFLWYEIFIYDNPCGRYPPPTPTPTPT